MALFSEAAPLVTRMMPANGAVDVNPDTHLTLTFSEEVMVGEKGFVLLDIDEETLKYTSKFIPIAKRTLYEVNVDVTNANSTLEAEKLIDNELKNINQIIILLKYMTKKKKKLIL